MAPDLCHLVVLGDRPFHGRRSSGVVSIVRALHLGVSTQVHLVWKNDGPSDPDWRTYATSQRILGPTKLDASATCSKLRATMMQIARSTSEVAGRGDVVVVCDPIGRNLVDSLRLRPALVVALTVGDEPEDDLDWVQSEDFIVGTRSAVPTRIQADLVVPTVFDGSWVRPAGGRSARARARKCAEVDAESVVVGLAGTGDEDMCRDAFVALVEALNAKGWWLLSVADVRSADLACDAGLSVKFVEELDELTFAASDLLVILGDSPVEPSTLAIALTTGVPALTARSETVGEAANLGLVEVVPCDATLRTRAATVLAAETDAMRDARIAAVRYAVDPVPVATRMLAAIGERIGL